MSGQPERRWRIAQTVEEDEGAGARPAAIVQALKRLVGFEMQFGPFAVAQLRLFAEVVDLTTPAALGNGKKMKPLADASHLRLYVADTLADPDEDTAWIPTSLAGLAQSRKAANAIKRKEQSPSSSAIRPIRRRRKGWVAGWRIAVAGCAPRSTIGSRRPNGASARTPNTCATSMSISGAGQHGRFSAVIRTAAGPTKARQNGRSGEASFASSRLPDF